MKRLGYTPATIVPDVEIHIPLPDGSDYVPHDYDEKHRGPVRLREALGSSLNIPAVDTIRRVGTENALALLHAFGFESLTEDAAHYGPALALGDGEITLLELARAYATLARGGRAHAVRFVQGLEKNGAYRPLELPPAPAEPVIDERIAAMLADVLSDKTARMSAFGDQNILEIPDAEVAAKTGTSKGFRDNVAVGFSRQVTVAVWAGNFDGSAMQGVSGISGAGPIFHDVMAAAVSVSPRARGPLLSTDDAARLGLARTSVCAVSGEIPTAACPHTVREWLPDDAAEHGAPCTVHVALVVDTRNGLLAGPGCAAEETATRVFERWPPEYAEWAERLHRPIAPEESSPNCPVSTDALPDRAVAITYPFDQAKFVIDPDRPRDLQVLDVRTIPPTAEVRIDDKPLPKSHQWPLAEGEHTITSPGAKPVHIRVR
jgi:penicillin-binding protein 1C